MSERPKLNDVVALLADVAAAKLLRGQVGTVVEELVGQNLLVEFTDNNGRAYALAPVKAENLLVLQYEREVA